MMNKRDYSRENTLRRNDSTKKRLERVMCGYVYHKYPEIYAEGLDFYNRLDACYPGKKDLRKTRQYLALAKNGKGKTDVKKTKGKTNSTRATNDNLVLEIPLIKWGETKATTTTTTTVIEERATVGSNANGEVESTGLLMSDDMLQQIVTELRADPALGSIFDDIMANTDIPNISPLDDIDIPNISPLDDDIDIDIPNISPLERELLC